MNSTITTTLMRWLRNVNYSGWKKKKKKRSLFLEHTPKHSKQKYKYIQRFYTSYVYANLAKNYGLETIQAN